uniref:Zinc metalloproteinase-disintegrin-like (Trinotate prediction) n=1 Tax=Myxobolus squamalis TaxID=59785 RepID=A0A6B2G083_MYXSQ
MGNRYIMLVAFVLISTNMYTRSSLLGKPEEVHNKKSEQKKSSNSKPQYILRNIARSEIPLYLDICIVVTRPAFKKFKDVLNENETYFDQLFFHVTQIFAWHNIHLLVREIDYWRVENKVNMEKPDDFKSLQLYFERKNYKYDAVVVFTELNMSGTLGMAQVGSICTNAGIAIIDFPVERLPSPSIAAVIAHELGHVIGFHHTEKYNENCLCASENSKYCVMKEYHYYKGFNVLFVD